MKPRRRQWTLGEHFAATLYGTVLLGLILAIVIYQTSAAVTR